jgi:gliding motility-associatede transport system auxiliary component
MSGEVASLLWFAGVLAALGILFVAGLKLPVMLAVGSRLVSRSFMIGAAVGVTLVANLALFRHDAHLDLTRDKAFTPSPEASAIIGNLTEPVSVTYFYQDQSPGARALNTMLLQLQRQNANLDLRLVDADRNPALASNQGVRMYNSAVLRAGERRIEVVTTDDREIALGLLRLLRHRETVICFASGHGEYDIDNFEFHTHFEGTHSHSHDAQGLAVVQMEQHGLGRLRRALEKLGLAPRKVILASALEIPQECAVFVEANPRTGYSPPEVRLVRDYLGKGGSALFLIEPDYVLDDELQAVLSAAGIAIRTGIIVDPAAHYFTDEQMIAVTEYGAHPVTRGLALSFYPGARPLERLAPAGVQTTTLVASSRAAYIIADRLELEKDNKDKPRGSHPLAIAAEGSVAASKQDRPFRLIVFGDADFASNSFFPYLSNADVVLAGLSWLIREERAPAMRPPVEVLPTVALTNVQMRSIFLLTVVLLPGLVALTGGGVWWLRR